MFHFDLFLKPLVTLEILLLSLLLECPTRRQVYEHFLRIIISSGSSIFKI